MNKQQSGKKINETGICVCPDCGFEKPHKPGKACRKEACDNCGIFMIRKGTPHYFKSKAYKNNNSEK